MNLIHYGIQRSGTNFLETLLKKNYLVHFLNSNKDRSSPLHKHCRLYKDKQIIPEPKYHNDISAGTFEKFESLFEVIPDFYLIISKDPYSWYLSYMKWAKKYNWSNVSHHYIEEYNLFYGIFIELSTQSDKFIFIRYVDLLKDTNAVINSLEEKIKLKKRLFARLALKIPNKVSQSDTFKDEQITYYLNEQYLNEYSMDDIQTLNSLLNSKVTSFLGYETKSPVSLTAHNELVPER